MTYATPYRSRRCASRATQDRNCFASVVRSTVARGVEAVVAGVALAGKDLAEISQLHGAAAFAGFRVAQHLAQLLARHALFVRQRLEGHRDRPSAQ